MCGVGTGTAGVIRVQRYRRGPVRPLLSALLHKGPDEALGIRLEDLVDLVEHVLDVLGKPGLTLLQIAGLVDDLLVDLLALPGGALLPARVLGRHPDHPPLSHHGSVPRSLVVVPTLRRSTDSGSGFPAP